ncbi:Dyp-type peroxidase domain-containing protein, partial [Streptomyces sp. NPDC059544]|uniref:Dyp-type peroxidase domain-containing protein n=1 Tax=Streptomyces sp. NPDC059544 TaxID=3346861 RepID=UPI00367DBDA1
MVESQAVIAPPARAAMFLVGTISPGGEATVRDLLQDLAGLRRSVGFRVPDAGLGCIVGIGSTAWGRRGAGPPPRGLDPVVPLWGGGAPRGRAARA